MAVIPSTVLKSKNIAAMGTNSMEEPKPDTVPITSETNANKIKSQYFSSMFS
jgi:hypothetical protein